LKRLIIYTITILATLTAALLVHQFRNILILLVLAILVSAAVRPLVILLIERLKLSRPFATIATYLLGITILVLLIFFNGASLLEDSQNALNDLATTYESRYPEWEEGSTFEQALAAELPPPDQFYQLISAPVFGEQIMGFAGTVMTMLGGAAVVLDLSIYWTIDQPRLERYWLSFLPAAWRMEARRIWREMEEGIGAYFRSEIVQSLTAVFLLAVIYRLMGVEYAIVLAVLAAIAWVIPLVGALFAVLPVLAVGLFNGQFGLSMVAALATVAILVTLELVVEPRLFNRRRYNSTTMLILMLIFVEDFGIVGLIMAPPIAAAVQILFNHLARNLAGSPSQQTSSKISQLHKRFDRMIELQAQSDEPVPPTVKNLSDRLSKLLTEAGQITSKNKSTR
jgi:predicted PurR-regulated permease PerM